ncbi:uncharacterized protein K489DRAFT_424883 [Dissoconium aciculare CBS 342.82]|uniref:Uncharacterized protein n=1 Tax=Dissoconium aciculare CBS 342.82 TaxID=1314786 RepID=A0A6J3M4M9_9PEZI|nr:uncharacterized protein K489DRAFT_424883 [Dissoconium aciculare CBS 342.82]KAF1822985.1 hypothetical protein K489DRAFT_424883 [Dissoconium aciculare CBS 342.82]
MDVPSAVSGFLRFQVSSGTRARARRGMKSCKSAPQLMLHSSTIYSVPYSTGPQNEQHVSRRRVRFACPSKAPRMSTGGGGGWWWMAGSCRVRFYPRRGHVTAHRGISRQSENGSHTSIPPRGQRARIVTNPVAHGPLSANAYIDRYMPIGAPRHVIGYTAIQYIHRRHWVRSPPCTGWTMPAHDDPAESSDLQTYCSGNRAFSRDDGRAHRVFPLSSVLQRKSPSFSERAEEEEEEEEAGGVCPGGGGGGGRWMVMMMMMKKRAWGVTWARLEHDTITNAPARYWIITGRTCHPS